ncbi:hypothetical protein [Streptomyces olivaceus]|uniref:hypothetical protein n=2 Tax=Streptomyces TaxID=1883 RepID=UPI001CCD9B1C|nr:hypothetical protein [Streptomyces olivaceus]MBZ6135444.1 hypothetical protein [Streptomyces olivaceus]
MTPRDTQHPVPGELKERGQLVASLGSSLRSGATSLGTVPKLLEQLLTTGGWRDFVTRLGDHITYDTDEFADFVETMPLQGLGADLAVVERLIGPRPDLLAVFYELTPPRERGRPKNANDVHNIFGQAAPASEQAPAPRKQRPTGNRAEAIMRKLAKDRPDLLEEVTSGRMKAYTAAVEAGWRSPQTTIPLTDPEAIARKLLAKLGTDQAQEVCSALARLVEQPSGDT